MTNYETLVSIFEYENKPLQNKEIYQKFIDNGHPKSISSITTMLSVFKKQKKLYIWKIRGMPSFFVLPSWINAQTNELKFGFDPYTKKRTDEPKDNSI